MDPLEGRWNNPAGPNSEVPNLGIAHIPRQKANIRTRCMKALEGILSTQRIEKWHLGVRHRITLLVNAVSKAIEND
jgi:hypothetical protein